MTEGISRLQLVLLRGSLRCMAVFGPAVLLFQIVQLATGGVLTWDARIDDSDLPRPGFRTEEGAHAYWDGHLEVHHEDPGTTLWLLTLVPTAIVATVVTVVGLALLRILRETRAGTPFFGASARRLRLVSQAIAAAAVLAPLTAFVANGEVLAATVPGVQPGEGPDIVQMVTWLVVALVVRVIAEAFRIGTQLRDDTEGLV